jgi:hypothetical protein
VPCGGETPPHTRLPSRRRIALALLGLGLAAVGALAGLAVAAFLSGARGPATVFALLMLAASPVLLLAWRRLRTGRR